MRNTCLLLITLLIALPQAARAQRFEGIEFFGGYSYMKSDLNPPFVFAVSPIPTASNSNFGMNGWQASITENATDWLGLTQQFSGNYGTTDFPGAATHFNTFSILSGPRLSYPGLKGVTPFVHALFGYDQTTAELESTNLKATSSSYAMAFGGGVDVKVSRGLAIRVFQADYYRPQVFGNIQNDLRISTGIVFRFGGRR
jgi:opacity protein-like surface antigen